MTSKVYRSVNDKSRMQNSSSDAYNLLKKVCNIIKIIRDKGKTGERITECHNVHEIYDNTEFCSRP